MIAPSPESLFDFYRDTFLPAYSDLVGFTVTKPKQVLTEIENTLAHLAQYHNPKLPQPTRKENLKKALDHLTRVTLDCYKLLWIKMHQDLELFHSDEKKRIALNISEEDFLKKYSDFRIKAQNARRLELISVGTEPLMAVESYKDAILIGKELMKSIDSNKLKKVKTLEKNFFVKETGIAFLIGFFSGLAANALWNYNPVWSYLRSNLNGFLNLLSNVLSR